VKLSPRARANWIYKPLVVVGAAAIAAVAVEIGLRLRGVSPVYTSIKFPGYVIALDGRALFRLAPAEGTDLNALGYRDREFSKGRNARRRVLFLGDSFVFGDGLPAAEAPPQTLERRLGPDRFEVFNMGIYGYGPDQSFLRLLDEGLDFQPDLVILGLYPANDFRDLIVNRLFEVDESGALRHAPRHPLLRALRQPRLWHYARRRLTGHWFPQDWEIEHVVPLFTDGFEPPMDPSQPATRRKAALLRALLVRYGEALEARGVGFLVVVFPSSHAVHLDGPLAERGVPASLAFVNEEMAEAACAEAGVAFVSLREAFARHKDEGLFIPANYHLSAAGSRLLAELLAERLATKPGWPDGSP